MNQQPTWEQIVRRRRILALIVLALVTWLVWGTVNFMGGVFGGGSTTGAAACAPGTVSIISHVGDGAEDQTTFDSTTNPMIWFSVVNNGKTACTFNTGAAVQFFTIKSADQVIWTSEQCDRKGLSNQDTLLQPGKEIVSPASEWKRVYSSGGGCGEGQAPADPGSYTLSTNVNSVLSNNYVQFELQ